MRGYCRPSTNQRMSVGARIARAVKGAVRDGRLAPDILHDIDFAALRPTGRIDVHAEHPEGGPESLAAWDTNPCLEAAVRLREESPGLEPGRRVPASPVPALVRG